MYCKKCGTEQENGQRFCPKCGTQFSNEVLITDKTANMELKETPADYSVDEKQDMVDNEKEQEQLAMKEVISAPESLNQEGNKTNKPRWISHSQLTALIGFVLIIAPFIISGFGFNWIWYVLLFLIGLFSFIMIQINEENENDILLAKIIMGVFCFLGMIMYLWGPLNTNYGKNDIVNNDNTDSSTESYQYQDYSNTSISFSSEQDVRTYLCNHRFKGGQTVSFGNNANTIYMDGTQLTTSVEIRVTSTNSATLRTHGPYGETTLFLTVSSGRGFLQDHLGGDPYISQ